MASSEYSRLRSIARKRIERLSEAGFAPNIHIPTVKELKAQGGSMEKATASLRSFLSSGQTVTKARVDQAVNGGFEFKFQKQDFEKRPRKPLTDAQKERRRERERQNRMMAGAWGQGEKALKFAKALKTLGVSVPPKQLPAFADYIEQRFAQGTNLGRMYRMRDFVEDFMTLTKKKGYNAGAIMKDFNQYAADQATLRESAKNMSGMSADSVQGLWDKFIETR